MEKNLRSVRKAVERAAEAFKAAGKRAEEKTKGSQNNGGFEEPRRSNRRPQDAQTRAPYPYT